MKKKNILLLFILTSVSFLPFIADSVDAAPFGSLTVYSPEIGEDIQYWNEIHLKCSAYATFFYTYESTAIYIDDILLGETSANNIDCYYGYDGYVGKHTIKFVASFTMGRIPMVLEESRDIYITSSVDKQDFNDLQIDKLHNLYSLGGQGMTICIIDTGLGFNDDATIGSEYDKFPEHIYYDGFGSFREIVYYRMKESDSYFIDGFDKSNSEKELYWKIIGDRNSAAERSYDKIGELHGSLVMSTLTQVAPHARYVFIDADSTYIDDAVVWLWENERYKDYEIDVLSMSWGNEPGGNFCENFELALNTMANDVDNPVIPVAATGNFNLANVWAPASFDCVIGVGGTLDSDYYSFTDHFLYPDDLDIYAWNYANIDRFSILGLTPPFDDGTGKYSLMARGYTGSGATYDCVQFHDDISDGSIEGWFLGGDNEDLVSALWLRTAELTEGSTLFKSGYKLRLYKNRFSMYRRYWDDYSQQSYWNLIARTYLDDTWTNKWWRMKFEAEGNLLKGWLWKEDGTLHRTLIYEDRCEDRIFFGYPGYSARTNLGVNSFIDNIKITTYDSTVDYKGYNQEMNWHRFETWVPALSLSKAGSQYGDGLDICAIVDGTLIKWNPYDPENIVYNSYEFRGTSNACPLVAGIIALSLQFYNQKPGTTGFLSYQDFNDRTNSIFKSTGEIYGTAPVDNDFIYGNYVTSRGFGLIDAYEIILYINAHY